jgi:DNA invertase Pin-like site-specific DNA recombinase
MKLNQFDKGENIGLKCFYSRVSSESQNEARQIQNLEGFDRIFIDKVSGTIPIWERPDGSKLKKFIDAGKVSHIEVHSIDRLGRDTISVLSVWEELTKLDIRVVCRNPNFQNLTDNGEPDRFSELLLSILSTMAKFERDMIRARQKEGIELAKLKGVYQNRPKRGKEPVIGFLKKHQKAVQLLEEGYKGSHVSKICNLNKNTVSKIKKIVFA